MKLWESYFRTWNKISDALTDNKKKQALLNRLTEMMQSARDDECATDYYGFLCDRGVCIEHKV